MVYTPKVFAAQQYVEAVATKKYTVPAASTGCIGAYLDKASFANSSAADVTVALYIVPPGGPVDGSTNTIPAFTVAAKEEVSIAGLAGRFIDPGTEIWWISGAGSAITGGINGRELT